MGIDLLDTPVRLTWDLHGPGESLSGEELLVVADRIAAAGVFFVTLQERPLAQPTIRDLLGRLGDGGCRVSVVCSGDERELSVLEQLERPLPLVQLDVAGCLDGAALAATRLLAILGRLRQAGCEPLLRLTPLRSNLPVIPELFNFCRNHGIDCLKLPNARIGDTYRGYAAAELPHWNDLVTFRQAWSALAQSACPPPRLEIHDRFLWEIMTPGDDRTRTEYGGCQAANSLGHIDSLGNVYACEAWPVRLGSLPTMELEQIWQAPQRFAVRARVAEMPHGCLGCRDYALCLGGCRGLGDFLGQSGAGRDLMCQEPRN